MFLEELDQTAVCENRAIHLASHRRRVIDAAIARSEPAKHRRSRLRITKKTDCQRVNSVVC